MTPTPSFTCWSQRNYILLRLVNYTLCTLFLDSNISIRSGLCASITCCAGKLMKRSTTHHDGDDFGFSACVSYASGMCGPYGPYMTRIGHWLNPSIISCWNRGPRDPRGVPWDQNFWSKFFLTSTSNELILWVLWIGYAKNAEKH